MIRAWSCEFAASALSCFLLGRSPECGEATVLRVQGCVQISDHGPILPGVEGLCTDPESRFGSTTWRSVPVCLTGSAGVDGEPHPCRSLFRSSPMGIGYPRSVTACQRGTLLPLWPERRSSPCRFHSPMALSRNPAALFTGRWGARSITARIMRPWLREDLRGSLGRGGRVVDGSGLENRRPARVRGFESHPLRCTVGTRHRCASVCCPRCRPQSPPRRPRPGAADLAG